MSIANLTFNGIKQLFNEEKIPTTVQVISLQFEDKMINGEKSLVSQISDGHSKIRCYWMNSTYDKIAQMGKNDFNGSIVRLKTYVTNKTVMVTDFDLVFESLDIIGSPVLFKGQAAEESIKPSTTSEPRSIDRFENQNRPSNSSNRPISSLPPSQPRVQIRDHSNYELIQVLYTGINNWSLYCRVNKVTYKDFTNNKGTQTRLLEFEIMDSKNWTMKCTIFGNEADRMRKILQPGEVYIFSQGIIKQDTYKKPSHAKDSPYTITFTEHSRIQLAIDDGSISEPKQEIAKLANIPQIGSGIEVDVIGILMEIGEQKKFVIRGKNQESSKRVIIICDPISKVECDVTLWRDQLQIDEQLKFKTIKLQGFKTHEYQGRYSLSAWRKSKITPVPSHEFQKYEGEVHRMRFDSISFKKKENDKDANLSSVKQLLLESQTFDRDSTLWSTFRVYLNQIKGTGKKWYEGCPHCKKSVSNSDKTCGSCYKQFDKPVFRYILNVEISDSLGTGSIWTTAHDDFANKIFSYVRDLPASEASEMSEDEFSQFCYRCQFQQFKVTVNSRMETNPTDHTRRLKHQVNTFIPIDYSKQAQINLQRIKTMCE